MFARRTIDPGQVADLERIEAAVRARYELGEAQIVLVSEDPARLPGGPERMTTILFWDAGGARRRLRLFKPAAEVAAADLPPGWLAGALADEGEAECC